MRQRNTTPWTLTVPLDPPVTVDPDGLVDWPTPIVGFAPVDEQDLEEPLEADPIPVPVED